MKEEIQKKGMYLKDILIGVLIITLLILLIVSIIIKDKLSMIISIANLFLTIIIAFLLENEKRRRLKIIEEEAEKILVKPKATLRKKKK